jgi:hypothetical protein
MGRNRGWSERNICCASVYSGGNSVRDMDFCHTAGHWIVNFKGNFRGNFTSNSTNNYGYTIDYTNNSVSDDTTCTVVLQVARTTRAGPRYYLCS